MSEFDKEAERERLREKYEQDKQDREATQRMSDLLLKGARMTNTHCGTCGDPLFEQNDRVFCPTCHGGPEGVEGTGFDQDAAEESTDDEPAAPERERPPESHASPEPPQSPSTPDDTAPSMGRVRADLQTTLQRFAGQAAATEDPRRAREALEAARAAAETLDALPR